MGACTMGMLRVLPLRVAHGRLRAGAVAHVWRGTHPERQRKSAPGISPSVLPVRNSRRGAEPPRKARSSIARRGARDATGRRGSEGTAPVLKSKAGPNR